MAGKRVHIVMDAELVARVDVVAKSRGLSRGEWMRLVAEGALAAEAIPLPPFEAVERALSEAQEPSDGEQADPGSVPSSEGVRSAAPAEQPEEPMTLEKVDEILERVAERSSPVGPARPFRPYPRGGKR